MRNDRAGGLGEEEKTKSTIKPPRTHEKTGNESDRIVSLEGFREKPKLWKLETVGGPFVQPGKLATGTKQRVARERREVTSKGGSGRRVIGKDIKKPEGN